MGVSFRALVWAVAGLSTSRIETPSFFVLKNKWRVQMSIKCSCPYCQQKLEADETLIGQTLNCPSCGKPIVVNDEHNDKLNSVDLVNDISTENEKVQISKISVTKIDQTNNHKETNINNKNTICIILSSVSLCLSLICLFYILSIRHTNGLNNGLEEKSTTSKNGLNNRPVENNSKLEKDHDYIVTQRQKKILETQPSPAFLRTDIPSGIIELVVLCQLSNNYVQLGIGKGDKWSKERYYSFLCENIDLTMEGYPKYGGDSYGLGFALKTSDVGKRLIEILKDGKRHIATIKVRNMSYDFLAMNFLIVSVSEINPEAWKKEKINK